MVDYGRIRAIVGIIARKASRWHDKAFSGLYHPACWCLNGAHDGVQSAGWNGVPAVGLTKMDADRESGREASRSLDGNRTGRLARWEFPDNPILPDDGAEGQPCLPSACLVDTQPSRRSGILSDTRTRLGFTWLYRISLSL